MARSVLIVDDSPVVRQALRRLFASEAGFDAFAEAANGREAIQKAEDVHPDLIVMDFSMPEMNGLEATRLLRKVLPLVPIILYSAYSDALAEDDARGAGVSALVSKSDNVCTLVSQARSLCARKVA
jgi:DNA-binding NarL/FixJ family response regulator